MESNDVTLWGRDYSAREFTPEELDRYQQDNPWEPPVQWLDRYIGYPTNRKCISHYPGMYERHWATGRPVSLFHQIGYTDMEGGFAGGRAHALTALNDARSVGWDGESHITACMDRFYEKKGYRTLNAGDLREYMQGFRSVLGDRAGFYGFYDSMRDAIREEWASFYIQCGARSAHVPGIHAWQENNKQPFIAGTATDILELYCAPEYAFGGTMSWKEELTTTNVDGEIEKHDMKTWFEGMVNRLARIERQITPNLDGSWPAGSTSGTLANDVASTYQAVGANLGVKLPALLEKVMRPNVEVGPEDIEALARELRESLPAGIVRELGLRLAEPKAGA